MTNRIVEKIAKQAWVWANNQLDHPEPQIVRFQHKFAELIIEECCNSLYPEDAIDIMTKFGIQYQPDFSKHDDIADIMSVEEWQANVDFGSFIPSDGSGYWAKKDVCSTLSVWSVEKPEWATHVAWYNK